jgi:hypothetical protein
MTMRTKSPYKKEAALFNKNFKKKEKKMRMRALFRVQLGPWYTSWAKTKESSAGMFLCLMGLLGQLRTWLLIYRHHPQAYEASVFLSLAICPLLLSAQKNLSTSIVLAFIKLLNLSCRRLIPRFFFYHGFWDLFSPCLKMLVSPFFSWSIGALLVCKYRV